jgi:hypothetical protein
METCTGCALHYASSRVCRWNILWKERTDWLTRSTDHWLELDAKYVQGMIKAPDMQPSALENQWIQGILCFDFKIVHVPAMRHKGPDALSCREPTDSNLEAQEGV